MNFQNKIATLPFIQWIITFSKKYSFPGFKRVPIYNVLSFIYREIMRDDIITRANSIAFSIFLALFPTLIFLFTILPLIPATSELIPIIDEALRNFLPRDAHQYLFGVVNDILAIKREGLLSVGFILAIYFGSNGMKTLMKGFDKSYQTTFKKRSYFKELLVAIGLTVLLAFSLIIAILLIILGKQFLGTLFDYLELGDFSSDLFSLLRWVVVAFVFYVIVSIIYRYGPSMYRRTPFFNPGAYLASILIILSSVAFSYFVNNFGKYNELYGSIGALIVLMIWLQINALILLIGFELNASIAVNRDLSRLDQKDQILDIEPIEKL